MANTSWIRWDDKDVRCVLDQHAQLKFYRAIYCEKRFIWGEQFQLRNNINDTIIFYIFFFWYHHFIRNFISSNLRTHDYIFCEQTTKIGMHTFKLFHSN
jgi:hypothetical protein